MGQGGGGGQVVKKQNEAMNVQRTMFQVSVVPHAVRNCKEPQYDMLPAWPVRAINGKEVRCRSTNTIKWILHGTQATFLSSR